MAERLYLDVQVLRAEHLPAKSGGSDPDPYVNITCGSEKERTDVCSSTINPVWMSSYKFGNKAVALPANSVLKLQVMDKETFSSGSLGEVTLKLESLVGKPRETAWFPLRGDKARGKLQLEYYCSDQPDEILLQGELKKLGGGHGGSKNWKNRFFVLTEDNLAYYESEKAFKKGDRPKGVVLLNAYFCAKTENEDQFEFTIHSYPKSVTCRALSEDAMAHWLGVLNEPLNQFVKT